LLTGFPVGLKYWLTLGIEDGSASSVDTDTGLAVAIASAVDANPFA